MRKSKNDKIEFCFLLNVTIKICYQNTSEDMTDAHISENLKF